MMSEAASQQEARRQSFKRGRTWIKYPFAEQLLEDLEQLLAQPQCHRMHNLLILGETNSGKTMTMARFERRHSRRRDVAMLFGDRPSTIPVLCVQTPPSADEARFYNAILNSIGAPTKPTIQARQLHFQTVNLLRFVGCRMLIIDEIHNLLIGPSQKLRQAQAMIRFLGNELQIPIVAVGIREAFHVFAADPQLSNRFRAVAFPKWQMDEAFMALLLSFEARFPDWRGVLTSSPIAARVLALSEGVLGEIVDLICAVRTHCDRTGSALTEQVVDACGYVSPTLRSRVSL